MACITGEAVLHRKPISGTTQFRSNVSTWYMSRINGVRYIATIHHIRTLGIYFLANEESILARYFESQEDPWIGEQITEYCAVKPYLRHITLQYLDRMSKLKLFL
jgi:hypothetical protein